MAKVSKSLKRKLAGNNRAREVATPQPPVVQLTLANAPIYQAKFLEGIRDELRRLNEFLNKHGV